MKPIRLETRLKDREYLAGPEKGTHSIADINCWKEKLASPYAWAGSESDEKRAWTSWISLSIKAAVRLDFEFSPFC
jgi:hypothetical protein